VVIAEVLPYKNDELAALELIQLHPVTATMTAG
jgi:hypothetical protein